MKNRYSLRSRRPGALPPRGRGTSARAVRSGGVGCRGQGCPVWRRRHERARGPARRWRRRCGPTWGSGPPRSSRRPRFEPRLGRSCPAGDLANGGARAGRARAGSRPECSASASPSSRTTFPPTTRTWTVAALGRSTRPVADLQRSARGSAWRRSCDRRSGYESAPTGPDSGPATACSACARSTARSASTSEPRRRSVWVEWVTERTGGSPSAIRHRTEPL